MQEPQKTQVQYLGQEDSMEEGTTIHSSEEGNSACLSSCSGGLRPLVELCVEPAGLCGRCPGVAVPLRVVPSPTGLPSKRGPGPLDCKEIQPVHSKGDQPWDFFGQKDAEAEILVLWPPDVKS